MKGYGGVGQQDGTCLQSSIHVELEGLRGIPKSNDYVMPLIVIDRSRINQLDTPRAFGELGAHNAGVQGNGQTGSRSAFVVEDLLMITGLDSASDVILENGKHFRIVQIGTIETQVIDFSVEIIAEYLVCPTELPFFGCQKINRVTFRQQLFVRLDPIEIKPEGRRVVIGHKRQVSPTALTKRLIRIHRDLPR